MAATDLIKQVRWGSGGFRVGGGRLGFPVAMAGAG